MRRLSGLMLLVFSLAMAGLLAASPFAEANGNCTSKLVGKSFDCSFHDNDFSPFTECWNFATGGVSQYFDLNNGIDEYGCACNPTGPSDSPTFDSSASTFECSDNFEPFSYNGKIKGNKLTVQGVGSSGEQYVATCTLRSSPCL